MRPSGPHGFDARHDENAIELLARLRVSADRRAWLLERTPFFDGNDRDRRLAQPGFPERSRSREDCDLSTDPASS
jgi:hypothetical protein